MFVDHGSGFFDNQHQVYHNAGTNIMA